MGRQMTGRREAARFFIFATLAAVCQLVVARDLVSDSDHGSQDDLPVIRARKADPRDVRLFADR